MKRMAMVLALAVLTALMSVRGFAYGGSEISFGMFYSSLGSHGEWITVDANIYAWRPMGVDADWRPYQYGRWIWTDDGWYWDSDEPWAWAAYHYGRWYYDDYYGWLWSPGYDWAPAWVEWRYGGDYVGWAPLGPYAVYNRHYGIHYSRRWVTPYHYWSFVDCGHMMHHDIHRYVYRTEQNTRFIGRTRTGGSVRPDNGRVVSRGPEPGYIEGRTDLRVPRVQLVDVEDRDRARSVGTGNEARIGVYRPRIEERRDEDRIERPGTLRESERMPSLDSRRMDVRRREVDRESGRDVERIERRADVNADQRPPERNSRWFEVAPREQRDAPPAEGERRSMDRPRGDRQVERTPEVSRGERPNPERQIQRAPDANRGERQIQRAPDTNRSERPSVESGRGRDSGNRGERSGGRPSGDTRRERR
jgi:hypothetical protein